MPVALGIAGLGRDESVAHDGTVAGARRH
jgi:hypothetical protein